MTLYNTYRPRTFADVIGQKHVVDTLRGAITKNRIGHAYLFTGPRGTGKTTLARIFAHAVNCLPREGFIPCADDICAEIIAGSALDIMEIDAASNTSVDYIRQLRDGVATAPTRTHYKVYIIDEVHMLSTGAFNALLKTLEEPPAHTIFIFATTEVHKLPATILSRVQRFDLTRLSAAHIVQKITTIATAEGYKIESAAAHMIALAASGAMRDAESLLAQIFSLVATDANITTNDVQSILGIVKRTENFTFIRALTTGDTVTGLRTIAQLVDNGIDLKIFVASTLAIIRHILLLCADKTQQSLIEEFYDEDENKQLIEIATNTTLTTLTSIIESLMTASNQIASASIPQLPLEIVAISLTANQNISTSPTQIKKLAQPPNIKLDTKSGIKTKSENSNIPTKTKEAKQLQKDANNKPSALAVIIRQWPSIITSIQNSNSQLSAMVAQCTPHTLTKNTLTILAPNKLFKSKLTEQSAQLTIREALATIDTIDAVTSIVVTLAPESPSNSLIANAANSMGGGKIVKST